MIKTEYITHTLNKTFDEYERWGKKKEKKKEAKTWTRRKFERIEQRSME
jgi:hypothetical protein